MGGSRVPRNYGRSWFSKLGNSAGSDSQETTEGQDIASLKFPDETPRFTKDVYAPGLQACTAFEMSDLCRVGRSGDVFLDLGELRAAEQARMATCI